MIAKEMADLEDFPKAESKQESLWGEIALLDEEVDAEG
jgi:hypothetical protein